MFDTLAYFYAVRPNDIWFVASIVVAIVASIAALWLALRAISDRKKFASKLIAAREQAEAANRTKSMFLANMSHELRTPLNAIIGFSEVIRDNVLGPSLPAVYREYAADINRSGLHLLGLINNILDLSDADTGQFELREGVCDIADLVALSVGPLRKAARTAQVDLDIVIDNGLPHLVGDERRLRQALNNLLSNAVKFTPPGGRITLRTALRADGELALTIDDTGIGMTAEQIRIARAPFAQIDDQLCRRFAGAGLGLPIAERLLQHHQARLDIASTPELGTTVTIFFPAHRLDVPPYAATDSSENSARSRS